MQPSDQVGHSEGKSWPELAPLDQQLCHRLRGSASAQHSCHSPCACSWIFLCPWKNCDLFLSVRRSLQQLAWRCCHRSGPQQEDSLEPVSTAGTSAGRPSRSHRHDHIVQRVREVPRLVRHTHQLALLHHSNQHHSRRRPPRRACSLRQPTHQLHSRHLHRSTMGVNHPPPKRPGGVGSTTPPPPPARAGGGGFPPPGAWLVGGEGVLLQGVHLKM